MNKTSIITLANLCSAGILSACQEQAPKQFRPNIIFIMSDDHGYQAISAYGSSLNETPNIDRIAHEGAIFDKGFVTNSLCALSRAVLLTGKLNHINGKIDNNWEPFNWNQENFAKILLGNGYQTDYKICIELAGQNP